jgi:hypothetical protein
VDIVINSYHHVTINGVNYRLAEDAEGNHYVQRRPPLRLQTGNVVQGPEAKFQLRPDLMQWSLTDWSEGEGQLVWDAEQGGRYWEGHNIDPFDEPGKLKLALGYEETNDELDATLTEVGGMTRARGLLHTMDPDNDTVRTWDTTNNRWAAETANAEAGFGTNWESDIPAGDAARFYGTEDAVAAIWSWDGTTFVEHCTDFGIVTGDHTLVSMGDYLFYYGTGGNAGVWEIPKSGAVPVTSTRRLNLGQQGSEVAQSIMCAGSNAVYYAQTNAEETVIYKIIPTTANGAGYADELTRLRGLKASSLWFHMGVLFIGGRVGTAGDTRQQVIMYIRGGEVGVLADLRHGTSTGQNLMGGPEAFGFDKTYFVAKYGPGDNTHEWTVFAVDMVVGAVAGTTVINWGEDIPPGSVITHNGSVFVSKDSTAGTNRIWRTTPGVYVDTSAVTARMDSAVNDYGLSDQKILQSVVLRCEPLATNDTIELQYQKDQDTTWTSIGTYSTDSGTGTTYVISTDTSSIAFRNLQIRVILGNGGTTSATPVVTGIDVFATVAKGVNMWELILELYDDQGAAGNDPKLGAEKITNVVTAAATEAVVAFDDGYESRESGDYDSHDVIVENPVINLERPGEGIATVILREVT